MKKYDYFSVVYSGKVFWETVTVRRPGRSKADIRNPLRYLQDHKESSRKRVPLMIFHERSRFATCQWELSTPTDISFPLTHRLVLRALEAGGMLICVHKADVKSMGTIFYKTKKHLKRDALNQGYQDSNLENDGVRVRCLTVWR